jgi:peptide/nickel transport system substrate-binding protein
VASLLALASCGGGHSGDRRLIVLAAGDFQHLDPGAAYYQFDYMLEYATQRALYGWKPATTGRPDPDLAAGPPRVTGGGRVVTVQLKRGVHFSPPVKREVTSADVKYAIERAGKPNVGSQYFQTYFGDLVGARAFQRGKASSISGIETPTRYSIVFRLTAPTAALLVQALSLPITAPVPPEYARRYDRANPSTYGQHLISTGPYTLTRYTPGVSAVLKRNPSWDRRSDWRPAYADEIDFRLGQPVGVASRQIIAGHNLLSGDFSAPAPQLRADLADSRRRGQIALVHGVGVLLIALNTTVPPLDNVDVRRAVTAATDRVALRLTRGGPAAGAIATHYLYPSMPGFRQAGGFAGTGAAFLSHPRGSLTLARSYMRKAGYPSGRYTGNARLLMITGAEPTGRQAAQVLEGSLAPLGLKVNLRSVSGTAMYSKFCGVPAAHVAICPDLGWLKDFYDPQTVLEPMFDGTRISREGSSNWSQLDDPAINRAMRRGEALIGSEARADAWGRIDRLITRQAAAIPWLWVNQANMRSADVHGVVNDFTASWDLSFTDPAGG